MKKELENQAKTENKITYQSIKENKEINTYIAMGNETLRVLGYTDHSKVHAAKVAHTS